MAAPVNRPPLEIHVHRKASPAGHKEGTFTGPPPKVRVDVGDSMQWTLKVEPPDLTARFVIRFLGFSWPFAGPLADINGDISGPSPNPALPVANKGSYLYAVQVTTVDGPYTIDHCPEADVGP
jgi:hypothetical protein